MSLFKSIDAPISAAEEGKGRFHYGITDEIRQERREQLLAATLSTVKDAAVDQFQLDPLSSIAVLGNVGALKEFKLYQPSN